MYKYCLPYHSDNTIWHNKNIHITLICLLLTTTLLVSTFSVVKAQSEHDDWSEPVLLFEGEGSIYDPVIVGDRDGGLHVFWRYVDDRNHMQTMQYIYYSYYNGINWSFPVDIIVANNVNAPRVIADDTGHVHMIWHGANNLLLYSNAIIDTRVSALNWAKPITLDSSNIFTDLVSDNHGRLHAVYAGRGNSGIYHLASDNGGLSWSNPVNIAITSRLQTTANHVRVSVDDSDNLHVVWTELLLPDGWPPVGLFYAHSEDGGRTWSEVTQLADDGYNQINVAAGPNNVVHVSWNGIAGVHGRYYSWSTDGGSNWSETIRLNTAGSEGSTGNPPMVVDSAGMLHLLVIDDGCVLYFNQQDHLWSTPSCISLKVMGASSFIEEPSMTITIGNKLHVIFWDGRKRLWYTTKETSSPPLPMIRFETDEPVIPTETVSPAIEPQPKPAITLPADLLDSSQPSSYLGIDRILLASIVPAIVVIGLVAIASLKNYRKH
jgi:hypothetical protein